MCGIFAAINKKSNTFDLSKCLVALRALNHRGPDDQSYIIEKNKHFFGQTLLSITGNFSKNSIDKQVSQNKNYLILFNGQIYNYIELYNNYLNYTGIDISTATDTEILVNLHEVLEKKDVPIKLRGMYAYMIYDKKNNQVTIARDIQGEKSLYIFEDENEILISSEISSIMKYRKKLILRNDILSNYFNTRHFMINNETVFQDIRQLEPGSVETLDLNNLQWNRLSKRSISEFIDPQRYYENQKRSVNSLTDELDAILIKSVKEMTPKNHSYSSIFSGGIDSTLISKYLLDYSNLENFVAVNHIGKDKISSDLDGFKKQLGIEIDIISIDENEYSSRIAGCQLACGSPLMSHSFVAQSIQCERISAKGHKVIFGGEGGDELFAGYDTYLQDLNKEFVTSPSKYSGFFESKLFLKSKNDHYKSELQNFWKNSLSAFSHIEDISEKNLSAMKYLDTELQLSTVGLRGSDLMSMMWGVESRTVFVSSEILKFAINLPKKHLLNEINGKIESKVLLKNLFLRHFPKEFIYPKQGFSGFPNESKKMLSNLNKNIDLFQFNFNTSLKNNNFSIDDEWKLINIEFFLNNKSLFN